MEHRKIHFVYQKQIIIVLICIIVIAASLILARFLSTPTEKYKGYYIYCIDTSESSIVLEKFSAKSKGGIKLVEEFIKALQKEPKQFTMKKAMPDNVKIDDFTLQSGGELTLYLSSAYGNYTGVDELLRRAAIVKTLCQIPQVNAVQIYVAGQPLSDSSSKAIGFMTADTFIDNTGGVSEYKQKATMNIYFASNQGKNLVAVPVKIEYDATIPLEQVVIEQLMKGPKSVDGVSKNKLLPTIPDDVTLNKITVKDQTCYIDFSKNFLNMRKNITSNVAIYSVVNTLTEISTINKVQFSIDGEQISFFNDTLRFDTVFSRNLNIVKDVKFRR